MTLYGPKREHANALAAVIVPRLTGDAGDDDMLAKMLDLDAEFPGCGWREAAAELQQRLVEDRQAREHRAAVRAGLA